MFHPYAPAPSFKAPSSVSLTQLIQLCCFQLCTAKNLGVILDSSLLLSALDLTP